VTGLWPSPWPAEDGGPVQLQAPHGGAALGLQPGERLVATSREAMVATMVVLRDPGQVYLLRHTTGDEAVAWVERIDPITLECLERFLHHPHPGHDRAGLRAAAAAGPAPPSSTRAARAAARRCSSAAPAATRRASVKAGR